MEETRSTATPFERVAPGEYGYKVKQVDRFLASARHFYEDSEARPVTSRDVRAVAFDPARGGYEAQAVDAALDRLEDAFAQRERDQLIDEEGEEAWLAQIGSVSAVLRQRLHRPDGERFRRPKKRGARSYDVGDVDELCGQLLGYFEEDEALSVDVVRRAVFRSADGRDGYEETQVDAFMDRVVELMAAID
nr:DivIVA domain-containing protein [Arthrobacter castelli]